MPNLLLPLIAALVYALATLTLKRSLFYGIGAWRTIYVVNLMAGLVFLPLLFWGGKWAGWGKIHEPLLAGLAFFCWPDFYFSCHREG